MMTITFTVWAQGPGARGRRVPASYDRGSCTQYISGLSKEQIQKITTLEAAHRQQMEQLRNERRSNRDFEVKDNIRDRMLKLVTTQRDEVRKLLTPEQQKEYDALPRDRYQTQQAGNRSQNYGRRGRRR